MMCADHEPLNVAIFLKGEREETQRSERGIVNDLDCFHQENYYVYRGKFFSNACGTIYVVLFKNTETGMIDVAIVDNEEHSVGIFERMIYDLTNRDYRPIGIILKEMNGDCIKLIPVQIEETERAPTYHHMFSKN